eukprot:294273_1
MSDNIIGQLGYVCPIIDGNKTANEMLARIVQVNDNGNKLKIVFLQDYIVFGTKRINLNSCGNWISSSEFRTQTIQMKPIITVPLKTKYQDIRKWILEIDDVILSNPAIVGLPPRSELMILSSRATEMCSQLLLLQDIESRNVMKEFNEILNIEKDGSSQENELQWMKDLRDQSSKWLENTPKQMESLTEKQNLINNLLFRFMKREFAIGKKVLKVINNDLGALIQFIDGEIKSTNDLRLLVSELSKELIPIKWNLYTMETVGVSHWIEDFVRRVEQLNEISQQDYVSAPKSCIWLGGLFNPSGFIAATRQYVAQLNSWSVEKLILCVEIGEGEWKPNSFIFEGVVLYGAGWDKKSGCLIL